MPATPITPLDPRVEMFQRGSKDAFFNMKALAPRPVSQATEIFDTDFEEEEEDYSEFEEDAEEEVAYSPRHSAGRRSETTLSSYEELQTPKSNNFHGFDFDLGTKPVEGPRGPHLFRACTDATREDEFYLSMSPMTPRFPIQERSDTAFRVPVPPVPQTTPSTLHRPISTLTEVLTKLDAKEVAQWNPRQVARWMYHAGFEPAIVEKFEENDISGDILITLKFEDLRELDIHSFGQRHRLWNEIHNLRDAPLEPSSPTEIDCSSDSETHTKKKKHHRRKHRKGKFDDIVSPLESVSIVGIEQLMPKPHKCSKGENCPRWKKQQRLIESFKAGHPVSPDQGGVIMIAGDPGNPKTAEAIRPFSEAQPSVVASSDLLGPGSLPAISHLDEEVLAHVESRDPQENVKQFLTFQHVDMSWTSEQPPSPRYEMFPPLQAPHNTPNPPHLAPHQGLRSLPRLDIPMRPAPPGNAPPRSASAQPFSPHHMERVEAIAPDLRNTRLQSPISNPYRFGTPASEMDIPITQTHLPPVARDASQSVPPDMSYRHVAGPPPTNLSRSMSRSSKRPSLAFPSLPPLDENKVVTNATPFSPVSNSSSNSLHTSAKSGHLSEHPHRPHHLPDGINHAGWMKKRKTKMLRHEWHEHHFTLTGTTLSMHKDAFSSEILESIDVDDYAIACSSLASSKINAAFKAMNIKLGGSSKDKDNDDIAAFTFQLIPTAVEKAQKLLRKRDSAMSGNSGRSGKGDGGGGKTHHFAVRSRDERIDWMRELMLAKALKQKGEGFEVEVNGNMI